MRMGLIYKFEVISFQSYIFSIVLDTTLILFSTRVREKGSLDRTGAVFGQTLLALKIYSTRYVHYRFLALIASARTQPGWTKHRTNNL